MPTELHVVPLAVLAALLAERGVGCRSLGAALPADALAAAVRRTAPAAVVLWSQLPSTADPTVVTGLPVTRPRYRTFVAGPGWDGAALPAGVGVLRSLVDAGEAASAAAGRADERSRVADAVSTSPCPMTHVPSRVKIAGRWVHRVG